MLASVRRAVEDVVQHPHPTVGSLHRLHREMRRLRAGLEVWRRLIARRDRDLLEPLDVRVRRLARLVGRIRDRDVAIDALETVGTRGLDETDSMRLADYRTRLRDDARTGRELLRAFLRAERDAHLFDRVGDTFHVTPPAGRARDVGGVLAEAHARSTERMVDAHRRARRRPSTERLHNLRIRLRRVRHLTELGTTVTPSRVPAFSAALKSLQQDLGRLHDLDVLLEGFDAGVRRTRWAETLRAERRRQRRAVVSRIRGQKFRPAGGTTTPRGSPLTPRARR